MRFTIFFFMQGSEHKQEVADFCRKLENDEHGIIKYAIFEQAFVSQQGEIYAVTLEITNPWPDEENDSLLKEIMAEQLIVSGLQHGWLPMDKDGKVIYIFPEYGFDLIVYSPKKGRLMELNGIVQEIIAEGADNFAGSKITAPDKWEAQGEVFTIHLRYQDYFHQDYRKRLLLAAFFRLCLKLKATGFIVVEPARK